MRKCKIDLLCDSINQSRGLNYPSIGYLFYADVKGDGIKRPRLVWQVISDHGGIGRAYEYRGSPHQTIKALQKTLNEIGGDHA